MKLEKVNHTGTHGFVNMHNTLDHYRLKTELTMCYVGDPKLCYLSALSCYAIIL